ncbi:hypothetical protein [Prescottella soli]|uniref:Lasso RiPP family leader peptide-containing protein n=1 Tax=Prescottella soli TaxID=1543852 RepID=A0ABW9FX52_9NOCA
MRAATPYKPEVGAFASIAGLPETRIGWQEPAPSAGGVRGGGSVGLRNGDGGD